MTVEVLAALLRETEKAHAASGHDPKNWAEWYADYMLPKLQKEMEGSQAYRAWVNSYERGWD